MCGKESHTVNDGPWCRHCACGILRCHFFWKKEGKEKLKRQCRVLCTLSCRGKETLLRQTYSPHKSINTSQKRSKIGVTAALNYGGKTTHLKWSVNYSTTTALRCMPMWVLVSTEAWKYVSGVSFNHCNDHTQCVLESKIKNENLDGILH